MSAQTTNAAGTELASERFGYVYDASQNLRWRTNNTTVTGFTNNTLNQLASLNSTTRTHDRRGNLISSVQPAETLLYTWDDENQLVSVLLDPPSSPAFQPWRIDFIYDGLRRLRRMVQYTWNGSAWTSQGEVRYLYDGMLIVQERSSANTPQVHYSRGLDLSGTIHGAGGIGGLLMRSHGYSGGNWSSHNAYHSDANGNVTALVNSSGVLQASYKYNPYGGMISSSGTLASANRMRFSSKPAIFSSSGVWGFYYYGYRFYDPTNQRWLNRDPLEEEGGQNLYAILDNSPLMGIDPNGLQGIPARSPRIRTPRVIPPRPTRNVFVIEWVRPLTPQQRVSVMISCLRQQRLDHLRKVAVERAWEMEREMVVRTGRGTVMWTPAQRRELLDTCRVKGFEGHHQNSVSLFPEQAAHPNNTIFVTRPDHFALHDFNWRIPTMSFKPVNRTPWIQ